MAWITRLHRIPDGYDSYDDGIIVDGFDILVTTNPIERCHTVVFAKNDESEVYLVDLGPVSPKRSLQPPIEKVVEIATKKFQELKQFNPQNCKD